jgi:NNP family nitrate/nitrite transporter-like MFS transporter
MLLGSVGRIGLGILADRYGGRVVLIGVMIFSVIPALLLGLAQTYWQVLGCALLMGVPMAIYPVGVVFVSRWYPPERQGTALGFIGLANIGQSAALLGAPLAAARLGYAWGFWIFVVFLLGWLVLFGGCAEDAAGPAPVKLREFVRPMGYRMSWILGLFYFLTFGSFLVMTSYLTKFQMFTLHASTADAGMRAAVFVVFAGAMRPLGGWMADCLGGKRVLLISFLGIAAMAALMTIPKTATFHFGIWGIAVAIGLGNGAVFKLVPEFFPRSVGTETGMVAAIGALGGFFPPIVLGWIRHETGTFAWGFVLLGLFALGCLAICAVMVPERKRAVVTT